MTSLTHAVSVTPRPLRDRAADSRETLSVDCSALAALCRPETEEEAEAEIDAGDAVPQPIEEEQITRPYPDEVYVQMMMSATKGAAQPAPSATPSAAVTVEPEPTRRPILPGLRSTSSNLMELVLLFAGAIALPVFTVISLQSVATATPVVIAAPAQTPRQSVPKPEPTVTLSGSAPQPSQPASAIPQ